ncbi:Planctomycete cytochrome C [Thalassoglobus neptunius]|uniref:Planctomycete cytochrome C n=2 Tax=Thalassoglobus neptunius TaxID=1938619 RepID=A0A5C5X1T0_9PLAN|nr:Planctomycete cytochrome C [Thalassoglobus neptunius]
MFLLRRFALLVVMSCSVASSAEQEFPSDQLEFFETRIRPVLVEHCYGCHNSQDTAEGDLILDHRSRFLQGGQSGTTLNLEAPRESLLLRVMRHEIEGFEMPLGENALDPSVIADFEKWIAMGAPDPRENPPAGSDLTNVVTWESQLQERVSWWSFRSLRSVTPPLAADSNDAQHPVDRFIAARLNETGLTPVPRASRRDLVRRLSLVVRGIVPTVEETESFLSDERPDAYERLVDRWLNSREFGEHWARCWMDVIRYAESHGSEGDPAIPYAWKYRDYLIHALNDDVPYDQLVREHVAGDLLENPRIDPETQVNQSVIATAHWRMCFHGFAPTDALDEKVKFVDDQINVFSKAFMALTVSCARCHNHKFDPISQEDYYALFGVIGSPRPGILDANSEEKQYRNRDELTEIKESLRSEQANVWLSRVESFDETVNEFVERSMSEADLFYPLKLSSSDVESKSDARQKLLQAASATGDHASDSGDDANIYAHWNLRDPESASEWYSFGNGTVDSITPAGDFSLLEGLASDAPLLKSGIYSHGLSTKHRAAFMSRNLHLDGKYEIWVRVQGSGDAMVRYSVQNYPRHGTVYSVTSLKNGKPQWIRYDASYWDGDDIHIELTTAADSPVLAKPVDRSWFGVREVVVAPVGSFTPPQESSASSILVSLIGSDISHESSALRKQTQAVIRKAIEDWKRGTCTDQQVDLLNELVSVGYLPKLGSGSDRLQEMVAQYRSLEEEVPLPNRVPGQLDAESADQALFIRGQHRHPGNVVARRFLESIDATPYQFTDTTGTSGRRQLAEDLIRDDNPLTKRVIVNRIWHYVFGAGLVRTVDNFGLLGEEPSHPELLDYLAYRFAEQGWSIKQLIRELLLTETWQQSSVASKEAQEFDPENRLLSHASIRRMTGEMLRDSILVASGQLDRTLFGPPDRNGEKSKRRSVYLAVIRNDMDPFLATFNMPVPFATQGRRDVTNVPAQSLTLLNDPFVLHASQQLGATSQNLNDENRIQHLMNSVLGRPADSRELSAASDFVAELRTFYQQQSAVRQRLVTQLDEHENHLAVLESRVRYRILNARGNGDDVDLHFPSLVAEWNFDHDLNDTTGRFQGTAHGDCRIEDGALVLGGSGYVSTGPLEDNLRTKSLEVIVQLSNLEQRGGGVMSVQTLSGADFDAIVYGEQEPQHWLAGSNSFQRTSSLQGPAEHEAVKSPVHLVMTYDDDGTISCYRNGRLYGTPYRKANLRPFKGGGSQILFGLRHSPPVENRFLTGRIERARLYDSALTAEELQALANEDSTFVSSEELSAAMSSEESLQANEIRQTISNLKQSLSELGAEKSEQDAWADFVHGLLNLKEFIYIR